jgi:2-polyprenyl-3-methyl-5-hydroxy-6-metoxy-1,4-benzoquinol methylase
MFNNISYNQMPWDCPISSYTEKKIFDQIECLIKKKLNQVTLCDFGAGNGRYLTMFAKKIPRANLWGVETDKNRICQLHKLGFNTLELDIISDNLQYFNDNFFDIVFCSNVLEHIPYKQYKNFLREIHRIIRKDGFFLVGMPNYPFKRIYDIYKAISNRKFFKYYLFDDPTHVNKMSIKSFSSDLNSYFDEINLKPSFGVLEKIVQLFFKEINHNNFISIFCDKYFGYAKR